MPQSNFLTGSVTQIIGRHLATQTSAGKFEEVGNKCFSQGQRALYPAYHLVLNPARHQPTAGKAGLHSRIPTRICLLLKDVIDTSHRDQPGYRAGAVLGTLVQAALGAERYQAFCRGSYIKVYQVPQAPPTTGMRFCPTRSSRNCAGKEAGVLQSRGKVQFAQLRITMKSAE